MKKINLIAPKRPKLDETNSAPRQLNPDMSGGLISIDAFARYLYKYHFDSFCTAITIKFKDANDKFISFTYDDSELKQLTLKKKEYPSLIHATITALEYITAEMLGENITGLPIVRNGFICHYSENVYDPNHTATIILGDLSAYLV